MATIGGETVFGFTSPRSPQRMRPEINYFYINFEGEPWNRHTQEQFMMELVEQDFYVGSKHPNDPAFSARDRINRAPKGLGFVDIKPVVHLTEPGRRFLDDKEAPEALFRQMMKFQVPSPFHRVSPNSDYCPWGKPYLELLRLIRHFGSLTFDEFKIFGMQLTDYREFDTIVAKIEQFRRDKANNQGRYKEFFGEVCDREIRHIYHQNIGEGNIRTRESNNRSLTGFIKTKNNNLRDYADAIFRYLRATQVVSISQSGHSISITPEKLKDVDYVLETVGRDPVFVDDEDRYKEYLFDADLPVLLSDDIDNLITRVIELAPDYDYFDKSARELKHVIYEAIEHLRDDKLHREITDIKQYKYFDDIEDVFTRIERRDYYDNPLMFEWNTWRAMVMLDGGSIQANLKFDDEGKPLTTAAGNMPDIVCDYGDFAVIVEVTLQTGQKQYDNEGEPVARHIGRLQEKLNKPVYCLFIAPTISEASIAHFYMLRHTNIRLYGGRAQVIPLSLSSFRKMVSDSYRADYIPDDDHVLRFINEVELLAECADDEDEWFEQVQETALGWLAIC